MATPGSILKEIHGLRKQLQELQTKIEQGPRSLKIQQTKRTNQEENVRKAHDEIKQLKVKINDKELGIKTAVGQIKKYEKQRSDVTNKKEYDALESEIKQTQAQIIKLEDEILEAMGVVDEKSAKVPEIEKQSQKVKAEMEQFEKDYGERMQRFAAEIERTKTQLKEVETNLPEEMRAQYNRLIQAMGADGLAGVEGRICTACYTEVPAQIWAELQRGSVMVCRNCYRMMYLNA